MASKAAIQILLSLLLSFTLVSSHCTCVCPTPPKTPKTPPFPVFPSPPSPPSTGTKQPTCPLDTLKLGVCGNLLGLGNVQLGNQSNSPCCSLLQGLVDLDAAVCLCTALKANVLGISFSIPIDLTLLLNLCGKKSPNGFVCA